MGRIKVRVVGGLGWGLRGELSEGGEVDEEACSS